MYNTDLPRRADLPTAARLKRSTLIAVLSAAVILVTIVLPSEYAIDPTGIGRFLGLTEMGEIKTQLAAEAEADRAKPSEAADEAPPAQLSMLEQRITTLERRIADEALIARIAGVEPAATTNVPAAQQTEPTLPPVEAEAIAPVPEAAPQIRNDEITVTLAPGQGMEIKLVMDAGKQASFWWSANGSILNYDTHGDGGGQKVTYEKGRGVAEDEGVLEAAFDGNHGWFWRNRTNTEVTLTLRTSGDYQAFKRVL